MARHFDLQSWLISKIWQDLVTLSARNPGQAAVRWRCAHYVQKQKKCSKTQKIVRKLRFHWFEKVIVVKFVLNPVLWQKNSSKLENLTGLSHTFSEKSRSSRCAMVMRTLCAETERVFENSENCSKTQVPTTNHIRIWHAISTSKVGSYRKFDRT